MRVEMMSVEPEVDGGYDYEPYSNMGQKRGSVHSLSFSQVVVGGLFVILTGSTSASAPRQPELGSRHVPLITVSGLKFKDLNRNGKLDPYEDWRLSPASRAADLIRRMTLQEKAGVMLHGTLPTAADTIGRGRQYDLSAAKTLIRKGINTFITRLATEAGDFAAQNNELQALSEETRLGIPLLISTDPRNQFGSSNGVSNDPVGFSHWPDAPGFAAMADQSAISRFANTVREEYRAVGIRMALSPQADLATEPRWPRIDGTYGEDPQSVGRLVAAYIEGVQGSANGVTPIGIATVVKHWVGYGAAKDGWDSHNFYGRFADLSGGDFDDHIVPFRAAFKVHPAAVMPTYSILTGVTLDGSPLEPVGAGFNHQLLTDLLRGKEHFDGFVLSDWAITNDCPQACRGGWAEGAAPVIGMPWGLEETSRSERFARAVNAGVDQIGGTEETEMLVEAVHSKSISAERVDEAVSRILATKFQLGLFEQPYVNAAQAGNVVGNAKFSADAERAQKEALVLLENRNSVLPLKPHVKLYAEGVSPAVIKARGFNVVASPAEADVILVHADAPYHTQHPSYFFGSHQIEGDLDFAENDPLLKLIPSDGQRPVVLVIRMQRPAILTQLRTKASAIVADFGISDKALIDALSSAQGPTGHLPFELPSSMAEVRAQQSDRPHDTAHPLYQFGYGLSW